MISDIQTIYEEFYTSIFEKVIEDELQHNSVQKSVREDSKLSILSPRPDIRTKIYFLNGNQLFGNIQDFRVDGKGKYFWADSGCLYEGSFGSQNLIEGHGKFSWSSGFSKYCGNFLNGKFHGQGQMINSDFEYIGNFDNSKFHDNGIIKSGNEAFDGIFSNGKKQFGIRKYKNGLFKGCFDEREMRICGRYVFDNGDSYCGAFKKGLFEGYGEYTWPSCKESYYGFWKKNFRNGLGLFIYGENKYVTIFENDQENGPGIMIANDGNVYLSKCMFKNGEFVDAKRIAMSKTNIKILKKIFDKNALKSLSISKFTFCITLLDESYSKNCLTMMPIYPFHSNWFDLDIEHDTVWNFVQGFPDTKKESEFNSIKHFINENIELFEQLYQKYAKFSNNVLKTCDANQMKRIGLWQFFRELFSGRQNGNVSYNIQKIIENAEKEFNILLFNTHDPFECISMTNFIHYILYVVLFINQNNANFVSCAINHRSRIFGVFATMLIVFTKEFLVKLVTFTCGRLTEVIQEDKKFFIKFIKIIEYRNQQLTIRDVCKFAEKCEKKINDHSNRNMIIDDASSKSSGVTKHLMKLLPFLRRKNFIIESEYQITLLDMIEIAIELIQGFECKRKLSQEILEQENIKNTSKKNQKEKRRTKKNIGKNKI